MKKTLPIFGLTVLCCSAGMAATVAIDLNGATASGTAMTPAIKLASDGRFNPATPTNITATEIQTWLNDTTGWQGTTANGHSGDPVWKMVDNEPTGVTASGDNNVSVTFINRNGYAGALVGTSVTLTEELTSYTGLTLSVDMTGLNSGAGATTLNIVYQTADGWQLEQLSGTANTLTGTTQTVSVDLTDKPLTNDKAYIVMSTRTGGGTFNSNLIFSMTATTQDAVPEPATASLSLLGLSLLMLRRKR